MLEADVFADAEMRVTDARMRAVAGPMLRRSSYAFSSRNILYRPRSRATAARFDQIG